jgi:Acetoacetate decarboxylase (ADC)
MVTASSAPARYTFQGRTVTMPVVVRDATSAAATYLVDARAARALLPGPELDVVELLPGRALLSVACIDYRDNDLGDYNEVSLAFFVRERRAPAGIPYLGTALDVLRGRAATWIWKLPVDQSFTCEAGRGIWGFPKTVERIAVEDVGADRRWRLTMDGEDVLIFTAGRGGRRRLPDMEMVTFSWLDGRLHRTRFVSGAEGVGFGLGGTAPTLGTHPIARSLRDLGLPARPLMTVWMEHSHATFAAPELV